ncbi:MAG: hypothetical protein IPM29_01465 [Planctomycetes bacterium]|nr:hypothetical protein [Planctomycetota bacterium]
MHNRVPCRGAVLFHGAGPEGPHLLAGLARHRIEVAAVAARPPMRWAAELRHREWGRALVACESLAGPLPRESLLVQPRLRREHVDALLGVATALQVQTDAPTGNVLRDRKLLLRFLDALFDDGSIAAIDHLSGAFWTRDALLAELSHDADLDVDGILSVHAVLADPGLEHAGERADRARDDWMLPHFAVPGFGIWKPGRSIAWLHTHGLAAVGAFDLDVLEPARAFLGEVTGFLRALGYAILEGLAEPGGTLDFAYRMPPLRLLPVAEFVRRAAPRTLAMRPDPDGSHAAGRVVLCADPRRRLRRGGRRTQEPLRHPLFDGPPPGGTVLRLSRRTHEQLADRARCTWRLLCEVAAEVEEFRFPVLAQAALPVPGGSTEALWFRVRELDEAGFAGELLDRPLSARGLREGDRRRLDVANVTGWEVLTPFGAVEPHAFEVRHALRENRAELRRICAATLTDFGPEFGPQA